MKQYVIIQKAQGNILKDKIDTTIYIDENLSKALQLCKINNEFLELKQCKWEVVELVSLTENKLEAEMTDEEVKEYYKTINDIETDLRNGLIEYDEWAAREYGEVKIDTYGTAQRLYLAGYRKITKIEE